MLACLTDCCLTSSCKYFMHIQDENQLNQHFNTDAENWVGKGQLGNRIWKIEIDQGREIWTSTAAIAYSYRELQKGFKCMESGFSPYTSTAMVHGQVFRIIARKPPTRGSSLSATWGIAGQLCCKSRAPVNHHRFPRVFNLKNNNRILKKNPSLGSFFLFLKSIATVVDKQLRITFLRHIC